MRQPAAHKGCNPARREGNTNRVNGRHVDSTMSITKKIRPDGSAYYLLVESTGYDLDGKRTRVQRRFDRKGDAKTEQARIIAERDALRNRSGRIALESYIDRFYAPHIDRLAASSRDTYEREIRLRIKPHLGRFDVRDIDRIKIQRMVDACGTEPVARKAIGLLRTILHHAVSDRLIAVNPASAKFVMPPTGKRRGNDAVISTFEAMEPLLRAVDEYAERSVLLIASTGLLLGLRPEERYGLDWEDIDLADRTITVRRAFTAASGKHGGNDLKAPKTAKSARTVPIPAALAERLGEPGSGALILGAGGVRISPSTAQKRWARFCRWCASTRPDAPIVTIENMRHSFATSYLHAGGNVEDLSRMLGHSDINTTYRRYVRPNAEDLRAGMDAVDGIFCQSSGSLAE